MTEPTVTMQSPSIPFGPVYVEGTAYLPDPVTGLVSVPQHIVARLLNMGFMMTAFGTGALTEAMLATGLAGSTDGLGSLRVARATFDPSGDATMRTVAAHTFGVTIPTKAIVCGGYMHCITAMTSTNSTATIAVSIQGANDLSTAAAVSGAPWSTTGLKAITPKANTPESTGIILTAARLVTVTVAVEALLLGKGIIFVYYLQSA